MSGWLAMNDTLAFSTSMHNAMRTRVNAVDWPGPTSVPTAEYESRSGRRHPIETGRAARPTVAVPRDEKLVTFRRQGRAECAEGILSVFLTIVRIQERDDLFRSRSDVELHDRRPVLLGDPVCAGHVVEIASRRIDIQ